MKNQRGVIGMLPIIGILVLIVAIGAGAYYFGKSSSKPVTQSPPPPPPTTTPTPTATMTPSPTATPTPTPTATPNSNYYISSNLGVSFYYTKASTGVNDSKILVKEVGNKIYVYSAGTQAETGQYLEVFAKDKNQTLVDAIKAKILTGYSLDDCIVKTITGTFTGQTYPANFQLAQISVPTDANDDMETLSKKGEKCPAGRLNIGGLAYFLADSEHPDKLIFLSIGQYAIDSGIGNKTWQNTIKFLP
ncbi:MAG: hypothetical protein WCV81_03510 [Microgenomates group bacterium]|jgi:hypothetical protein